MGKAAGLLIYWQDIACYLVISLRADVQIIITIKQQYDARQASLKATLITTNQSKSRVSIMLTSSILLSVFYKSPEDDLQKTVLFYQHM